MPRTMARAAYADMYGPTTGDRVRLADTDLIIEVEKDSSLWMRGAPTTGWPCSCGGSNRGFLYGSWVVPDDVIASANRAASRCDAIGPRLPA